MNSASNVSSHQGTTSLPEKSEGRGSAEKPSEGAVGGRSVSSVADDDMLAIVSAGQQNAGITEESAGRTLSRRDAAQRAPSGVVLTMPVDRTAAVQLRLQRELEIVSNLISELKISGDQTQPEKPGDQAQTEMMSQTMHDVAYSVVSESASLKNINNKLKKKKKLGELSKRLESVFDYIEKTGDRDVARDVCRSKAYVLYSSRDVVNELRFLKKIKEFGGPIDNLPESFLFQHLTLGIGVMGLSSKEMSDLFQPEDFYDEIKRWLSANETQEKELEELLESGFAEDESQVKIFRNGIKALFEEGVLPAAGEVERCITELGKLNESKSGSEVLRYSVYILKFAKNLRLIDEGYFDEALENVKRNKEHEFEYLDEYIRCQVLRKTGKIALAVGVCWRCMAKGYPFLNYLQALVKERDAAGL